MNRYICIHGHFYQPPRENPWLEEVEWQDSAYPFHDWNQRITAECYAPNSASRILDNGHITRTVNNYESISFNFGPTLISWMEKKAPEVLELVVEADRKSRERFGGHGSALAQVYNHMIMPLANAADKRTQVRWGRYDFERIFGRPPEGMWLPETAVDLATLETLVDHGISFTVLAPRQAHRVRREGERRWHDVSGARIDPKVPYTCRLPSGRRIGLFFYDGPISQDLGFGGLLSSGEAFANRLMSGFDHGREESQLMHIATDGETYGHHRPYGDMALAYCLHHLEQTGQARVCNYGQYLEMRPPSHEVEIYENSSWSCVHGIERWRANCGCNTGMRNGWHQEWRGPLRAAMDWLRDGLFMLFEDQAAPLLARPWAARDDYIAVVEDRSPESLDRFFETHAVQPLAEEARVRALKLLEMQRHAMLMYTSCGWFFDEISGIENVQVLAYAARAMQLGREVSGIDLEPGYLSILERAPSNLPELGTGARAYERYVKPQVLDLQRVGAHYALASLFLDYNREQPARIYCYTAQDLSYERVELGRQKLALGTAILRSDITTESCPISFAVVHLGDHNFIGGVTSARIDAAIQAGIRASFQRSDITELISLMDRHFGTHSYSLWSLFKDEQRKILNIIMQHTLGTIEFIFREVYQNNLPVMRAIGEAGIPLPRMFRATVELIINTDLRRELEREEPDANRLRQLAEMARQWSVELDRTMLGLLASETALGLLRRFAAAPADPSPLVTALDVVNASREIRLPLNLWKAQNLYFRLENELGTDSNPPAELRESVALFRKFGPHLK